MNSIYATVAGKLGFYALKINMPDFMLLLIAVTVFIYYICIKRIQMRKLPPGPIGLPLVGYLPFLGKYPHKTLADMSDKYGHVIGLKLGPQYSVVINDYELMKEVLSHPNVLGRSPNFYDPVPVAGFSAMSGEQWKFERKLNMFLLKNLGVGKQSWELALKDDIKKISEELESSSDKPVNIKPIITLITLPNLSYVLIGKKIGDAKWKNISMETQKMISFVNESFSITGRTISSTIFPILRKVQGLFKISDFGRKLDNIDYAYNFIRQEVKSHKEHFNEFSNKDFIDMYLTEMKSNPQNNSENVADFILEGDVLMFLLAALDTTSNSLEWMFRLMAAYPEIQETIQNELDNVIGDDDSLSFKDKLRLPYTIATIHEFQRFATLVPLSSFRSVTADIRVGNYIVPKGSEICGNIWGIHNNELNWTEPEKFKPERFLTEDKKEVIQDRKNYVAFSLGKRNCPGQHIAYVTIFIIFTHLLKRFRVTMPQGIKPDLQPLGGLVVHLKPQPLCFIKRK